MDFLLSVPIHICILPSRSFRHVLHSHSTRLLSARLTVYNLY
jgi:hypothetical protein